MAIKMRRLCDLWTAISHTSPSIKWHLAVAQCPHTNRCWLSTDWETIYRDNAKRVNFFFCSLSIPYWLTTDDWRLWSRLIPFDWITQIATHSLPNWIEKWFCRAVAQQAEANIFCMKIIMSSDWKKAHTSCQGNAAMLIALRLRSECD